MNKLLTLVLCSVIVASCGGGSNSGGNSPGNSGSAPKTAPATGSGLDVKQKDKATKLDAKSGWVFSDDWTVNMPDGKAVKTATREIIIANYDLDTQYGKSSTMKKMTTADQMRIVIQLADKEDIGKDSPVTTGEFASKSGDFSRINNVMIYTFADGNEIKTLISGGNSDNKGSIKIISANADSVSGEIDFSNTDNSIKGGFTAKVWRQGK